MAVHVLALRHGCTAWNVQRRMQGRRDEPLSACGRAALEGWRLPAPYDAYVWVSSPLQRCVESARLLGARSVEIEPRIVEMDWGAWEGWSLAALRTRDPAGMREREARGLDFRAPDGESPRQVGERVAEWLREVGAGERNVVMVSHKGVVRALLARALGWDMTGKPPVKLRWECGHLFTVERHGGVGLTRPNIALERSP